MRTKSLQFLFVIICLLVVGFEPRHLVEAQTDTGYKDFSYGSARAPTGEKPQSKLWFHDGLWWAVMYNRASDAHEIYWLNWSTQTWATTGVQVDNRLHSTHDALSLGNQLFIASAAIPPTTSPPIIPVPDDPSIFVVSFNYNSTSKTYTPGEISVVYNHWVESVVIDQDSLDRLWMTFTDINPDGVSRSVYISRTRGTLTNWDTPSILNLSNTTNLTIDDISTLVAFSGNIGVMWSNQNMHAIYFGIHEDSDPDVEWSLNTPVSGDRFADDHLNIKSLQADSAGKVFAVVKTSLNDIYPPDSGEPLVYLLILPNVGSWSQRVVAQVKDNWTRPILLIDEENREIYIFATKMIPPQMSGAIYYKHIDLDDPGLQFVDGPGEEFIEFPDFTHINNAASTKQSLNSTTNLVVIAGDDTAQFYVHNIIDLPDTPPPPVFNVFLPLIIK